MPRRAVKVSDIDSCGLTLSELQELWLGAHPTTGSCFRTREELVAAWQAGRAVVMRLWGSHGRRPRGFYEFEWPGNPPAYDVERSTLWRADALSEAERSELEAEWRREFDAARGKSASERRDQLGRNVVVLVVLTALGGALPPGRVEFAPPLGLELAALLRAE